MRVLWLSHLVPYPPKGGVLQRSYYLLREAAKRHQVDLLALVQPAHQTTEAELHKAQDELDAFCNDVATHWLQSDTRRLGRLRLLIRSLVSSQPYDVNWLSDDGMFQDVRRLKRDYDLIHVDTVGLTPYLEPLQGIPFVLNHHNVESQMLADRAAAESNALKKAYMRREARKLERWERRWCRQAATNAVVSELDGRRLNERVPEAPVQVVQNGVDTEYFRPMTSPEEHDGHLVFVGGMSWYPNRDAMLWFVEEIWPALIEDRPSRRAVLIGRDPPRQVLRAADSGALSAPGFVDDVRPQVDSALAYVCPIRKGGGTRLKVLDALAMAKPLVATSFAVEGLGLEAGRHYLRAEAPADYVQQVRRLEESPGLRRRLGSAGRVLVEDNFAWHVVGENLELAYQKSVSE